VRREPPAHAADLSVADRQLILRRPTLRKQIEAQTSRLPVELLPCSTAGTDKSETIVGTNGRDTICGFDGDDTIDALGGNDWIDGGGGGGGGWDIIKGGPGNDTISGGNGPDRISGGPGNDHITGGLYPDRLSGGSGNDWIDAADGYRDSVDCGPGNDTIVTAKPGDKIKNCEHVVFGKETK
jgi:Ca2+-binding RTX toxin-like protein